MRVAIVGSRDWNDWDALDKTLLSLDKTKDVIISGGARGVDSMAAHLAKKYGFKVVVHPADWDRDGRSAGYIRNEEIVLDSDIVLAFWDGESRGTLHTITLAERYGKPVRIFTPALTPDEKVIPS